MAEEGSGNSANLSISWRVLAAASASVALASLAALATLAGLRGADALSTVALALAVIAFVVQLIVFIVQMQAANSQLLQSRELFGEMERVLADISVRAQGTEEKVTAINERLLEPILEKALGARGESSSSESPRQLASEISELVASSSGSVSDLASSARRAEPWRPREPDPRDPEIISELTSWPPEEEAPELLNEVLQLTPQLRRYLAALGKDDLKFRRPDAVLDPGVRLVGDLGALTEQGWVERPPGVTSPHLLRLTDEGRRRARLFTANEPAPEAIREKIEELRRDSPTPSP